MKLKNSNLLVSGCSYTDSQFWIKRGKGPCWPDFLTEKLNMSLINVAQGGAGNEYIYSSILDTLVVNKNIKFVIVMWSEFQRTDFERLYDSRTKRKWTTLKRINKLDLVVTKMEKEQVLVLVLEIS